MPSKRGDAAVSSVDWSGSLASSIGGESDIASEMVVVMMEAANSAGEDLKGIMAGVRSVNAAKRLQRELLAKVNRDVIAALIADAEGREFELSAQGLGGSRAYARVKIAIPDPESPGGVQFAVVALVDGTVKSLRQLEGARDALQGRLDSMSEMGEMESLRLQMAMDRLSKMMSTLSNLLKKQSDTDQAITGNIR